MPYYVVRRGPRPIGEKQKRPITKLAQVEPLKEYPAAEEIDAMVATSDASLPVGTPVLEPLTEPGILVTCDHEGALESSVHLGGTSTGKTETLTPIARTRSMKGKAMAMARVSPLPPSHDEPFADAKRRDVVLHKTFTLSNLTLQKEGHRGGDALMSLRAHDIALRAVDTMQRLANRRPSSAGRTGIPIASRLRRLGQEARKRSGADPGVAKIYAAHSGPPTPVENPLLTPHARDRAILTKEVSLPSPSPEQPSPPPGVDARCWPPPQSDTDMSPAHPLPHEDFPEYQSVRAFEIAAQTAMESSQCRSDSPFMAAPFYKQYHQQGGLREAPQAGYVLADGCGTSAMPSYCLGVALPEASFSDLRDVEADERADVEGAWCCGFEQLRQAAATEGEGLPVLGGLTPAEREQACMEQQLALQYEEQLRRKTVAYEAQVHFKQLLTYLRTAYPEVYETIVHVLADGPSTAGLYAHEVQREYDRRGLGGCSHKETTGPLGVQSASFNARGEYYEKVYALAFDEGAARHRILQDARDALRPVSTAVATAAVARPFPKQQLDLLRVAERIGAACTEPEPEEWEPVTAVSPTHTWTALATPSPSAAPLPHPVDKSDTDTSGDHTAAGAASPAPVNYYPSGSLAKALYEAFYMLCFDERQRRGDAVTQEAGARRELAAALAKVCQAHARPTPPPLSSAALAAQREWMGKLSAFEFEERFAREDLYDDEAYTRLAVIGVGCPPIKGARPFINAARAQSPSSQAACRALETTEATARDDISRYVASSRCEIDLAECVARDFPAAFVRALRARRLFSPACDGVWDARAAVDGRVLTATGLVEHEEQDARAGIAQHASSDAAEIDLAQQVARVSSMPFIAHLRKRRLFSAACDAVWEAKEEAVGRHMLAVRVVVIDENEARDRMTRHVASDRYHADLMTRVCRAFPAGFLSGLRGRVHPAAQATIAAHEDWEGQRFLARRVVIIDENEGRDRLDRHVASGRAARLLAEEVCCRFPTAFARTLESAFPPVCAEVFGQAQELRERYESQRQAIEANPWDANEIALSMGHASREAFFEDIYVLQFEERMGRQDLEDEFASLQWTQDVTAALAQQETPELLALSPHFPLSQLAWQERTACEGEVEDVPDLVAAPVKRRKSDRIARALFEQLYAMEFEEKMGRQDIWEAYAGLLWAVDLAADVRREFPTPFVEAVQSAFPPAAWAGGDATGTPSDGTLLVIPAVPPKKRGKAGQHRRESKQALLLAVHAVEFEEKMGRQDVWEEFASRQWEAEVAAALRGGAVPARFLAVVEKAFVPQAWHGADEAATPELRPLPSARLRKKKPAAAHGDATQRICALEFEEKMARLDIWDEHASRLWEVDLAHDVKAAFPGAFLAAVQNAFVPSAWVGAAESDAVPVFTLPALSARKRHAAADPFVQRMCEVEFEERMGRQDVVDELMSLEWERDLAAAVRAAFAAAPAFVERLQPRFVPSAWAEPDSIGAKDLDDAPDFFVPLSLKKASILGKRAGGKKEKQKQVLPESLAALAFEEMLARQDVVDEFFSFQWEAPVADALLTGFPDAFIGVMAPKLKQQVWLEANAGSAAPSDGVRLSSPRAGRRFLALSALAFEEALMRRDVLDEFASNQWLHEVALVLQTQFPKSFYILVKHAFPEAAWGARRGEEEAVALVDTPIKRRQDMRSNAARAQERREVARAAVEFEEMLQRRGVEEEFASRQWECEVVDALRRSFPPHVAEVFRPCFGVDVWLAEEVAAQYAHHAVVPIVPAPGMRRAVLQVALAVEFEERMSRLDIVEEFNSRQWEIPLIAAAMKAFPSEFVAARIHPVCVPSAWHAAVVMTAHGSSAADGVDTSVEEVILATPGKKQRRANNPGQLAFATPQPARAAAPPLPLIPSPPQSTQAGVARHENTGAAVRSALSSGKSSGESCGITHSGAQTPSTAEATGARPGAYLTLLGVVLDEEEGRYYLETDCDRAMAVIRGLETSAYLAVGVRKQQHATGAAAATRQTRLYSLEQRLLKLKDEIPFPLIPIHTPDSAPLQPTPPKDPARGARRDPPAASPPGFAPTPPKASRAGGARNGPQPVPHSAPLAQPLGDHQVFMNRMLQLVSDKQDAARRAIARVAKKERAEIASSERSAYLRCSLKALPQIRPASSSQPRPSSRTTAAAASYTLPTL